MGCVISVESTKEFTNLSDGITIKEKTNYSISVTSPLDGKEDAYEILKEVLQLLKKLTLVSHEVNKTIRNNMSNLNNMNKKMIKQVYSDLSVLAKPFYPPSQNKRIRNVVYVKMITNPFDMPHLFENHKFV